MTLVLPFYAGLKDGRITNGQFSASSSWGHGLQPWRARLDNWSPSQDAWAAKTSGSK